MVNDQEKYFVFNGKKSSDFGVWASELGLLESPAKRVEIIEVAGRNGDIIIEDGSYENVKLKFKDCFMIEDFSKNFNRLKAFLYRQKGYQRLETPWLPDEYRLAAFEGDIEPTVRVWEGFGKFDLTFNCKPQRFLKSGEEPIYIFPPLNGTSTPFFSGTESLASVDVTLMKKPENGSVTFNLIYKDMGQTVTQTIGTADAVGWSAQVRIPYMSDWRIEAQIGQSGNADDLIFSLTGIFFIGYQSVEYITGLCGRSIDIENPTGFRCAPVFKIYGDIIALDEITSYDLDGNVEESWSINGYDYSELTFTSTMDCENEYLYYEEDGKKKNLTNYLEITHRNMSRDIIQPSFPKLGSGKTNIYSYITNSDYKDVCIVLYPHWFTI